MGIGVVGYESTMGGLGMLQVEKRCLDVDRVWDVRIAPILGVHGESRFAFSHERNTVENIRQIFLNKLSPPPDFIFAQAQKQLEHSLLTAYGCIASLGARLASFP